MGSPTLELATLLDLLGSAGELLSPWTVLGLMLGLLALAIRGP